MTVEPVDASELLNVDLTSGYTTNERGQEVKPLMVHNPEALVRLSVCKSLRLSSQRVADGEPRDCC